MDNLLIGLMGFFWAVLPILVIILVFSRLKRAKQQDETSRRRYSAPAAPQPRGTPPPRHSSPKPASHNRAPVKSPAYARRKSDPENDYDASEWQRQYYHLKSRGQEPDAWDIPVKRPPWEL